jgi:hypothetical protein
MQIIADKRVATIYRRSADLDNLLKKSAVCVDLDKPWLIITLLAPSTEATAGRSAGV